jgi:hypothetical protein
MAKRIIIMEVDCHGWEDEDYLDHPNSCSTDELLRTIAIKTERLGLDVQVNLIYLRGDKANGIAKSERP